MPACELCEAEDDYLSGCRVCGKMICSACEAAVEDEDDSGEVVCEECF